MRDIRMYIADQLIPQQSLVLPEKAHRHASKVLRLRHGDILHLFNGDGYDYIAIITNNSRNQTTVFIKEKKEIDNESPLHITLYLSLLKGEPMDRTLQKAVELGVKKIVPVNSERSERQVHTERAAKRYEHWLGIIIASAMQCGRAKFPDLTEVYNFSDVVNKEQAEVRWIFSPHDKKDGEGPAKTGKIALLIGPEGGFSQEEVELARQAGWRCQFLGKRILRADTAAIAAMVRAQSRFGDLEC